MSRMRSPSKYTRPMSTYSGSDGARVSSSQLSQYLQPGELLLWSGRPDPSKRFSRADVVLIPFSIMWGGFAFFWESSVFSSGAPIFFKLWGIPFVGVGIYIIFGRFIYKRRRKLRTAYGITKSRAIIAVGTSSMSDMPLSSTPTTVSRSRDGTHVDVVFGQLGARSFSFGGNAGMGFPTRYAAPSFAFYDVANPQELLNALNQAKGSV